MNDEGNKIIGPCKGCFKGVTRRDFLKRCGSLMSVAGAGLVLASSQTLTSCASRPGKKVKVGLISVCAPQDWNLWPYVNFDYGTRNREIQDALSLGCPEIEFVPLTVEVGPEVEIPVAVSDADNRLRVSNNIVIHFTLDMIDPLA